MNHEKTEEMDVIRVPITLSPLILNLYSEVILLNGKQKKISVMPMTPSF